MGTLYHIYCDESRQTCDRFMILGGVIFPSEHESGIAEKFRKYREKWKMQAELKWTKVSGAKLGEYKSFIDLFHALNSRERVHYHAMILDTHQIDHKKFNKGDKEIGFYKFYYQLLLHSFGRQYSRENEDDRFLVFLDYRKTSYKLSTLQQTLNMGIRKRYNITGKPWRKIEPRDSKETEPLQLVDIVTGAIGFVKNGYDQLPNASPAKQQLAQYIAGKVHVSNLGNNTPWGSHRFTIWNFQLQK